jgi:hypothetical protein
VKRTTLVILLLATAELAGCGGLARRAAQPMIDGLNRAVMKQNDPQTVRDGAPAYLLLADALVEASPDDPDTLMTAAQLYSAYNAAFVAGQDAERAKRLSVRARDYAFRAAAKLKPRFAALHDQPFAEFAPVAAEFKRGDEKLLYLLASTWAAVVQADSGNWNLVADLAKIELLARRLVELDEGYHYGAAHLALGVVNSILPGELGGKPEEARSHFEKALELGRGKFFPAFVLYAENYAKRKLDRKLYESLLRRVVDAPADGEPELTLINTLAQQQAKRLLAEAPQYFDEEGTQP